MDFKAFSKPQLVQYLKERDFPTSAMRKEELLLLCERFAALNVPVVEADDSADCHDRFRSVSVDASTFKIELKGAPAQNINFLENDELRIENQSALI